MENKEVTLQTILDVMNSKFKQIDEKFDKIDKRFEQIDEKFDKIDKRFEQIDERLDGIDTRITKIATDNQEEHEKIFKELKFMNNTLLKLETEHEDKLKVLFDATQAHHERQYIFSTQYFRLVNQVDNNSFRISNLEKAFAKV